MRISKILKTKHNSDPFISHKNDCEDKDFQSSITICGEKSEDIFHQKELPKYFRALCSLTPKKEFQDVCVESSYFAKPTDKTLSVMRFNPYGKDISLNGFVSSIDIELKGIVPDYHEESSISEEFEELLPINQNIYTKKFKILEKGGNIKLNPNKSMEPTDFNHYISKAYLFAGKYHKGIETKDIEQYVFFVGTGVMSEEYITVMSSKDILKSKHVVLSKSTVATDLLSLEDSIVSGEIKIEIPEKNTRYESVCISKNTVISNDCFITFKKV